MSSSNFSSLGLHFCLIIIFLKQFGHCVFLCLLSVGRRFSKFFIIVDLCILYTIVLDIFYICYKYNETV